MKFNYKEEVQDVLFPEDFKKFYILVENQFEANMLAEMFKACTRETDTFFGVNTKTASDFLSSKSSVDMREGCLKPLEIDV